MKGSRKVFTRFQQFNEIVDTAFQKLPPRQCCLLVLAWRHADERGRFSISAGRSAKMLGISRRQAIDLFASLRKAGAIKLIRQGSGTRAPVHRIIFDAASGEADFISTETQAPSRVVKSPASSGEVHRA